MDRGIDSWIKCDKAKFFELFCMFENFRGEMLGEGSQEMKPEHLFFSGMH